MPSNLLFSTYRGGENRITASMLAVFERIDSRLLERLLTAVSGESAMPLITFSNQVVGRTSVPDAAISANFRYLFETKIRRDALRNEQLREHLRMLDGVASHQYLFVVTPDPEQPPLIASVGDERVIWFNFLALDEAINNALDDSSQLVSEQSRFLLRELQALFAEEGLLSQEDTVIVAARRAYPQYLETGAYVCQPGRSFRGGIRRFGFFANSAIQREIPMIRHRKDNVRFTEEQVDELRASDSKDAEIAELVSGLMGDDGRQNDGDAYQVFLLTSPTADETMVLPQPIMNTTLTRRGNPWAWTLGQRYVRSEILEQGLRTTDELDQAAQQGSR